MPGRLRTELYCLCWNDARMLPFFFRHYDSLVDKYFIFDNGSTDGSLSLLERHGKVEISHFDVAGDSFVEEERRLGDTMWRRSNADWVIVTDIDEHIYHPHFNEYLQRCTDQGITAIQSVGYEMVSDSFPTGPQPLLEQVTIGTRSSGHDRLCVFNPKALTETNFTAGRHEAKPAGRVLWPDSFEVLLLHYKQLGVDYAIARSAELRQGLRPKDLAQSWGVHYTWSPDQIVAKWQEIRDVASPVPGLGVLRHLRPADYFRDERIIKESGLFDREWYLASYPDVKAAGADAFFHFCNHGWKEGRRPNFYFDPEWYCSTYPELQTGGRNPLCDYVERGEKEGAWPSPHFDPNWYREQHGLDPEANPLQHYLARRQGGLVSPLPSFDVREYCQKHSELATGVDDPYEDYCKHAEAAIRD
ncbi:MAG TPA: glycosyltransferase family 2 protein [Candidatus Sulfotelmatobacter sp.]|nr:glycosyltransferase family 2 protein [Candidatus Sulfotelmatobacter sp.]